MPEETTAGTAGTAVDGPVRTRDIDDVATLRVLSDPLRFAIVRTLMIDAEFRPVVMSAKEIAAALGEPQTKLYRHLKQLEEVGLIQVAETRMVSGILEQRYRTGQINISLSRGLLADPATRSELVEAVGAAADDFRDEMLSHLRTGRIQIGSPTDDPTGLGMVLQFVPVSRLSRPRAIEFRRRLGELMADFTGETEDADGVRIQSMIAWYALEDEPAP